VRVAEGSVRDALSALDQVIAFSGTKVTDDQARTILGVVDRELILDFFAAVRGRDCDRIVAIVDTLFEKGYQPVEFLEDVLAQGRDLLLARTVSDPAKYLSGTPEEIRALAERAAAWSEDELLRLIEIVTREEGRIKNSTHARFLLEALGIRLARLADLKPIEEILAALEGPGPAAPAPGASGAPVRPAGSDGGTRSAAPSAPRPPAGPVAAPPPPAAVAVAAVETAPPVPIPVATEAPVPSQALVEALLQRVHEERVAIGSMLEQAIWIQAAEESLRIVFSEKHGFFRDKVQSREVSEYLRSTARALGGRDLRIVVETGAPGSFEPMSFGAAAVAVAAVATAAITPAPPAVAPMPAPAALPASGARPAPAASAPARPAPGGAAPRPAPRTLDEASRQALRDRALQEPAVRTVMDLFGGEIVDVEPL